MDKIGLYGGTFDPPHLGHLISAQALAEDLGLARVIFVPSGTPPHKMDHAISPADQRVQMLERAIADNPCFEIDDWELRQTGPTYTFNSVLHFKTVYPEAELYWLVGLDSLLDLPSWYRFAELIETVNIVTARRGGVTLESVFYELKPRLTPDQFRTLNKNIVRTPMIEVSARDIRRRIRSGRSIRYLVPPAVEAYIREKGLYQ